MSLIRNSSWNLLGTVASAAVMIPSMGYLARQLDIESFGLLTLVLAFVGYASVLDGGISRAIVREIALAGDDLQSAKRALGTGVGVITGLGLVFSTIVWISAPKLVELIRVDDLLKENAIEGLRWTSLMILPILLGIVWMSPIEAKSDFARLNVLRVIGYTIVFGCSVITVYWSPTFSSAVIGMLIGRIGMALLCLLAVQKIMGLFVYPFCRKTLTRLVRFGGWLTVSGILVPMVYYLDRFILSAFAGASVVAFYAAPSEAINKILTLPGSVARALFPMLAAAKPDEVIRLRKTATLIQAALGVFLVMMVLFFGDQMMGLWLGDRYAIESGLIIKIMIFGVFFNALSMIPLMELQAKGHSKLTAWAHLIEVIPIIALLLILTTAFGIVGTAIAWVSGTFIDFCLQAYLCRRANKQKV